MARRYDPSRAPTFRQRYAARAKHLLGNRPFKNAITQARASWNGAHPEFPGRGTAGSTPTLPEGTIRPFLYAYPKGLEDAAAVEPTPGPASQAVRDWEQMIQTLCREWWPPRYYPVYSDLDPHPATWVVAAAILGHTDHIQADDIGRSFASWRVPIRSFGYDPTDPLSHPLADTYKAVLDGMTERLHAAVDHSEPLTHERIDACRAAAFRALVEQEQAERKQRGGPPTTEPTYRLVEIIPGMAGQDWDRLRDRAQAFSATDNGDEVRRMVADLRRKGWPVNKTATMLGLDWHTVNTIYLKLDRADQRPDGPMSTSAPTSSE